MKQFNCDADVKTKVSRLINHNRCTKKCKGSKYLVPVSGSVLNNFYILPIAVLFTLVHLDVMLINHLLVKRSI